MFATNRSTSLKLVLALSMVLMVLAVISPAMQASAAGGESGTQPNGAAASPAESSAPLAMSVIAPDIAKVESSMLARGSGAIGENISWWITGPYWWGFTLNLTPDDQRWILSVGTAAASVLICKAGWRACQAVAAGAAWILVDAVARNRSYRCNLHINMTWVGLVSWVRVSC